MTIPTRRATWAMLFVLMLAALSRSSGPNAQTAANPQLPPNVQPPPIDIGPLTPSSGLNIVPVFEGWEANPDGTFNMVFGYMNRNYDEEVDIPIGPNNSIEPGGPDRSQPTHFYPRRNRFVFRVKVPKDWGSKDVVWTLTARGRTEKAYGSLLPVEIIDSEVIGANFTGATTIDPNNKPPTVTVEGPDKREISVGQPLTLVTVATDDGIPKRTAAPQSRPPGRRAALGLRVSWITYRGGSAKVAYDPVQALTYSDPRSDLSPWKPGWMAPELPPDGRIVTRATFSAPGTYVLRVIAHDGWDYAFKDVTVTARPSTTTQPR